MAGTTTPLSTYTQQQHNLLNQVIKTGSEGLNQNKNSFEKTAKNANFRFQTQSLPSIAERFTSGGSPLSSPNFKANFEGANADFQTQLAALEEQHNERQQDRNQRLLETGLNARGFENIYHPEQQSAWSAAAPGVAHAGTAFALNQLDKWWNKEPQKQMTEQVEQEGQQPGQQQPLGQDIAGQVAKTAAGTAGTAAATVGGKAASAAVGGLGAKALAGATAVLTSPYFWVPVAIAGLGYGIYAIYNHYNKKWEKKKLSPGQAAQLTEEGLKRQREAQDQSQQQQGGNLNYMSAPNFAPQGA